MTSGATRDCHLRALVDGSPHGNTRFDDDFEPNLSNWVASHGAGTQDWSLTTAGPHSPTHAAFSSDPATVSDQYLRTVSPVAITAGDELSFWHSRGLESGFDGSVVEISTDGGTTWADIGEAAFTENPYNATIGGGFGSPISGRRAFSGTSGYVQSVASLAAYAGQNIQIRFRTASDSSVAGVGWTVDDVQIGNNVSTTNRFTTAATGLPDQTQDLTTQIVAATAVVPAAPTVTGTTTPAGGAARVAFASGSDGGSPITGYTAQCVSTDGGANNTITGTASPITVNGLTGNKSYHCRVSATNAVGTGPRSAYGDTVVVTLTAPGAPTITSSTPLAGAVRVAFTPGNTGGSPVTGYTAQCVSTDGGANNTITGTASPITVNGLSGAKSYRCRVSATNAVGTGPRSAYGDTVTIPTTAPGRPTVTSTTPLTASARVAFTPGTDGGSPITGYTGQCRSTDGGRNRSVTGPASPITVTGLTSGNNYHCRVRATNAIGNGPYSTYGTIVTVL